MFRKLFQISLIVLLGLILCARTFAQVDLIQTLNHANPNNNVIFGNFSADEKRLATSVLGSKEVLLWDIETGEQIQRFALDDPQRGAVGISPDNEYIAIGVQFRTVVVFKISTAEKMYSFYQEPAIGEDIFETIHAITFSTNHQKLIMCVANSLSLWSLETGEQIQFYPRLISGSALDIAFLENNRYVFTSWIDGYLIDLELGSVVNKFEGGRTSLLNDKKVITFNPDNQGGVVMQYWDLFSKEKVKESKLMVSLSNNRFKISPNGKHIAVPSFDNTTPELIDINNNKTVKSFTNPNYNSFSFSSTGRLLAGSKAGDSKIDIYDITDLVTKIKNSTKMD